MHKIDKTLKPANGLNDLEEFESTRHEKIPVARGIEHIHHLFDSVIALLTYALLNSYERCSDGLDESDSLLRHGFLTITDEILRL